MSLSAGSRFGSYEIVGALGAGGMGEVYRARDIRLHRDVAIKVLPAAVAADADRLARFEREAQMLAALNHPRSARFTVCSMERRFRRWCLELVDGPTLADRIAQGPLAIDEAQPVARQIAEALEAAHEAGIVHRDLKPANIKLRPDGTVKVLDFGLAKALDGASGSSTDPTNSPTLTALGTKVGLILGTAAYMSPEQARGRTVDKRADIWAFGAVLWEMLTGRRLFDGETISDTLAAVLTKTPDLTVLPPTTPGPLRHLISRCLERDPKLRLRDIGEARVVLTGDLRPQPTESPRPRARQRLVTTGIVAAIVAGFVLAFLAGRQRAAPAAAVPVTTFTQVTDRPSIERQPSISPDGRTVVFVGDERGNDDLYLVRVGGRNVVPLTADSDADETTPSFSPDGTRIAFRSERGGGGIFIMDATGESVRRLTDSGFDPDWSPDGTALIVAGEPVVDPMSRVSISAIWVVTVAKGEKRQVFAGDAVGPRWSPSGNRIAYWSRNHQTTQRDVFTVAADGSQAPVPVTSDAAVDWSPTWSPDGRYIYFASNRGGTMNLWRVPIDEVTGQTLGIFEPVTTPSAWSGGYDFSADGRQLVFAVVNEQATIRPSPSIRSRQS